MAFNTDIQEKPKHLNLLIIIGIVMFLYVLIRPFLDWNEGLTASIEIVLVALFVGAFFLFGIVSFIYIFFKAIPNFKSFAQMIGFLAFVLVFIFSALFFVEKAVTPALYVVFENKKTIITSDYQVKSYQQAKRVGVDNYFLYFDHNKVQINKSTYQKLRTGQIYDLTVTYKPRAEVLYDLQISQKNQND